MAVIGCDIPVKVSGAVDALADRMGVWVKTQFKVEGNYLYATTYLVAAGEPQVFSLRVDLRPLEQIAAKVHERLHQKKMALARVNGEPVIGFSLSGAWRSVKKTAKKIGKNKIVKAVSTGVKAIVRSKAVGVALTGLAVVVPPVGIPAVAAYAAANAALVAYDGGKKLYNTATEAKRVIDDGKKALAGASTTKAVDTAKAKAAISTNTAKGLDMAKKLAMHAKQTATAAAPIVAKAQRIEQKLASPQVKAKLTTIKNRADSAKKLFSDIATKTKFATGVDQLQAMKDRAIVNVTAKNRARLAALADVNAGGLPSLLIDNKGRIRPGRYRVVAKAPGKRPDVLYQGAGKMQTGVFAKIAGLVGRIPDELQIGAGTGSPVTVQLFAPPAPREKKDREFIFDDWLKTRSAALNVRKQTDVAIGGSFDKPWRLEVQPRGAKRWYPQYGTTFEHPTRAKTALQWYRERGYRARLFNVDTGLRLHAETIIGACFSAPARGPTSKLSIGCDCEGSQF